MSVYLILPVVLLLIAHYLIVIRLDLSTVYLRLVSLLGPIPVGFVLYSRTNFGVAVALLLGLSIGVLTVTGMLISVSLVDATGIVPSTLLEWQEAFEYSASIAGAVVVGNLIARALQLVRKQSS